MSNACLIYTKDEYFFLDLTISEGLNCLLHTFNSHLEWCLANSMCFMSVCGTGIVSSQALCL